MRPTREATPNQPGGVALPFRPETREGQMKRAPRALKPLDARFCLSEPNLLPVKDPDGPGERSVDGEHNQVDAGSSFLGGP